VAARHFKSHDPLLHGAPFDDHKIQNVLRTYALEAIDTFDLPKDCAVRPITISENASILLSSPKDSASWVLRIHRSNYHSQNSILSEVAWVEAIAKSTQVIVPHFRRTTNQQPVVTLASHGPRFAVLTRLIEGQHLVEPAELREFETVGAIAGELHRLSRAWRPPKGFFRFSWDLNSGIGENARWGSWRRAPLDASAYNVVERACSKLSTVLANRVGDPRHWGLIHADMRSANLLAIEQGRALIDFDDCGYSWYLYDLATAVSFFEHAPEVETWVERWIEGYQQYAQLTKDDRQAIWPLIVYRRLVLVGWSISHQTTSTAGGLDEDFLDQTVELCNRYLLSRS
jgi:Ser/Thr protein kinase RdoA (MazF antagonist)